MIIAGPQRYLDGLNLILAGLNVVQWVDLAMIESWTRRHTHPQGGMGSVLRICMYRTALSSTSSSAGGSK